MASVIGSSLLTYIDYPAKNGLQGKTEIDQKNTLHDQVCIKNAYFQNSLWLEKSADIHTKLWLADLVATAY